MEKLKKRELLTYLSWREAYGNKIKHGHWDFTRGRMFMSCLRDVSREFWGNMPDSRGLGGTGQWGSGTLRTPFLYWRCIGPLRILTSVTLWTPWWQMHLAQMGVKQNSSEASEQILRIGLNYPQGRNPGCLLYFLHSFAQPSDKIRRRLTCHLRQCSLSPHICINFWLSFQGHTPVWATA